jgi:hypothetical protein
MTTKFEIIEWYGKEYKVYDKFPNICFIHIGKCGGSFMRTAIFDKQIKLRIIHGRKVKFDDRFQYFLWIRNPLNRFVSAFNSVVECVNYDVSGLRADEITLNNCTEPKVVRRKIRTGFAYSRKKDHLVNLFKTPNALAESLANSNKKIKNLAMKLITGKLAIKHIRKGIGFYLNNGQFIKKHNNNILLVGKMEKMEDDLKKFADILGVDELENKKVRENKSKNISKYLSPLAIKNLYKFYRHTDYRALKVLKNKGWIDQETYESYHGYSNL